MERNKYIKQKNNEIELYCSILLIPLIFCSIANYKFTSWFGGYILFGVYAFSFMCLLVFNRRQKDVEFEIKAVLAFLCFAFIYLLINLFSYNTDGLFGLAFFLIAVLYAFGVIYNSQNFKMLKYIIVISLISVLISVIFSVIVLIEQPGASRIMASNSFDIYGKGELAARGLAGFGVTYSLIFFIPVIFHYLKNFRKKANTLLTIVVSLIIVNIVLSGYTIALILCVLAIIMYLFLQMKSNSKFLCIMALIILMLFQSLFLPDFLYYISELFGSEQMADHIVEIADILAGKASLFDLGRVELLKQSWEVFLSNPIYGGQINELVTGGHSTFFDVLGATGLMGIIPYCWFLYFFHKQVKKLIQNPVTKKIWTLETILFFSLQTLNPILSNYEIVYAYMGVVPASLFYIDMLGEKRLEDSTN